MRERESMMAMKLALFILILGVHVEGYAEPGKWTLLFNESESTKGVAKTVYSGTKLIIKVNCESDSFQVSE